MNHKDKIRNRKEADRLFQLGKYTVRDIGFLQEEADAQLRRKASLKKQSDIFRDRFGTDL